MRKNILILVVLCLFCGKAYAEFNYGIDTYEKVDDILIVNSLGDKVIESVFNYNGLNLGYNDFISENAFKNDLYNQGYTKVFDSNDLNLDLVEVGYMGLKGNPREFDADYVLRKEYNKYSAQSQDTRIDINRNKIDVNEKNININSQDIQNNMTNIHTVDNTHTTWNENQDNAIINNSKFISNNASRIDNLDSRVNELEKTQYIVNGEIRIVDTKKWQVNLFADYNTGRNIVDRTGIKFQYKFGESYYDKELKRLENKLNQYLDI